MQYIYNFLIAECFFMGYSSQKLNYAKIWCFILQGLSPEKLLNGLVVKKNLSPLTIGNPRAQKLQEKTMDQASSTSPKKNPWLPGTAKSSVGFYLQSSFFYKTHCDWRGNPGKHLSYMTGFNCLRLSYRRTTEQLCFMVLVSPHHHSMGDGHERPLEKAQGSPRPPEELKLRPRRKWGSCPPSWKTRCSFWVWKCWL